MQRLFKDEPLHKLQAIKPVEVKYSFKLVSLDTAHVTMPLGNKKYIVVATDHFKQSIDLGILTK